MNKKTTFIFALFFVFLLSCLTAGAKDIELKVKNMKKVSEEEIAVKYYVINKRDNDLNSMVLAFKILEEGKPIGCKEIETSIPKGSDESDVKETKIRISGHGGKLKYKSNIFFNKKRYKIDEWFSECPRF